MIKQLLENFEKEIESTVEVDEVNQEVVFNSIKLDMLSGAKNALELLSKNEQFLDESTNESLSTIGQLISDLDDEINGLVETASV
ncbi:hypothetical protein [Empedobacter sp.]|uniref:hypothetical protein n=1 Tax=Empedobacter sp. TaxID=1927715 RepID=UPI00289B80D5|nr:hypothetical protein [Empedobacter sp.]